VAIIGNGGNLAVLVKDTCKRVFMRPPDPPATAHPVRTAHHLLSTVTPGTGPP
jgi:hypothetical protein